MKTLIQGGTIVTATDLSCLLHVDGLRRRRGDSAPRAVHLAEILAGSAT